MSNYTQLYRDNELSYEDIAYALDDINKRLAALESKQQAHVSYGIKFGVDERGNGVSGGTFEPATDPLDDPDPDGRTGPYAYDNGYGAGYSSGWNAQNATIERLQATIKQQELPAPSEPTSEPFDEKALYVWARESSTRVIPATPAQIRAAAMQIPDIAVAVEFLKAWLTSATDVVAPYYDGAMMLNSLATFCEDNASGMPEDRIRRMAAVLEEAAKEATIA